MTPSTSSPPSRPRANGSPSAFPTWLDHPDRPLVLAFGGNALLPSGRPDGEDEARAERLAAALLRLLPRQSGLVHGNGPQVGTILERVEATRDRWPAEPLDVLVAETQGSIGYLLTRALRNVTQRHQRRVEVAAVATQVIVDADDAAFAHPTKPIGPIYDSAESEQLQGTNGWAMVEFADKGMRRVVASPRPRGIVELHVIADAVAAGRVVVAGGGGGIPVAYNEWGHLTGVEAVIDKDRTASLLARTLSAAGFVILTAVPSAFRNFGRSDQERIAELTVTEARELLTAGAFPPGSMGPKIEAAADYAESIGTAGLITSVASLPDALAGTAGTWVKPG